MNFLPGVCRKGRSWLPVLLLGLALPATLSAQEEPRVAPAELKQLSIEQLMEIDVTSVSRRSEQLSKAAAAITVITGEDLRRSGVTSLPDALRLSVSVHVAQSNGNTWGISSRGFNSTFATADKMLVLIDGRSVYTPLFSGVFWDVQDVPLEDIDRIEVIRGPGATLWGANAVNGVINIITKSAKATQGGLVTAAAGNVADLGSVRWGGKLGEGTYYRAYGKYYHHDALELEQGGSAQDPLRRTQGGFRVDRDDAGAGSLTLQGDIYHGGYSELLRPDDTDLDGGNLLGRWKRQLASGSSMELQVYYDRTHRRTLNYFEERRNTVDVDFQHHFPIGRQQDVVWGLGSRVTRDEVTNSQVVAFLPDHRTLNLFSAFAQDEIALVPDRLRLTLGSKLEYNSYTNLEVQPSVRAAWTPDDRHTVWAAISRAVRTPTRLDEDVLFLGPQGQPVLSGNADVVSEELLAYELGYRIQPTADLLVDVAAFYDVYNHLRSFEPAAGGGFVFANELDAQAWGVELRSSWQPAPWWRLHAGYAWFGKHLHLATASSDPTGGQTVGDDPRNRYSLRSVMDLPGGFELDGWLRYVDELTSPEVKAYTELDVHLGWKWTERLELALVGQNLLHARHVEFAPNPFVEAVQRSVFGKVTWHF
ncbi:MAG TPA: TonB-dependent receptor [Thermoanaerobaculia bacterium]|jgi:iron complex outermembrane receptor protein|nr:TonB-dependent receptor [Thermoanaerobaculia bacterium]